MRARSVAASVAACALLASRVAAQPAFAPPVVGRLVGPAATLAQPGLRLYGTDLAWTFAHQDVEGPQAAAAVASHFSNIVKPIARTQPRHG
jgi:hypothetical protein